MSLRVNYTEVLFEKEAIKWGFNNSNSMRRPSDEVLERVARKRVEGRVHAQRHPRTEGTMQKYRFQAEFELAIAERSEQRVMDICRQHILDYLGFDALVQIVF
jgi:hypothetical protein